MTPIHAVFDSRKRFRLAVWVVLAVVCGADAKIGAVEAADETKATELLDLSTYAGKVVYVDFWASWCKPCKDSMPWMNSMQETYGEQGLVIVGVNLDRKRSAVDAFLKEVPINFEIVMDPDGILAKQYDLQAMPSSFVYDRGGTLVTSTVGFQLKEAKEMESIIGALLRQKTEGNSPTHNGAPASDS